MTRDDDDVPEFVRDALGAGALGDGETADSLALLSDGLPSVPSDGRRLFEQIESMPLRYAPFFERLQALWDLPESEVERTLARAAEPVAWKRAALPGVRLVEVAAGPRLAGARVTLTRFRPGLRFPTHYHDGPETLLVLEGRYADDRGRSVGPGELHEMPAGSEHSVRVDRAEPCVVAAVEFGMHFTGPFLRVLAKLFG